MRPHCPISQTRRPEWYPAYNTEIQATQLVCVQSRFSVDDLNQQLLDLWYRPGAGQPIPEAQGRADTGVPSLILSNWRKHAFAPRRGMNNLVTGCRFRWNSAWAALSKEWAEQHLPQNYVTIHIRSGNPLRTYWIPKNKNGIVHCFQQVFGAGGGGGGGGGQGSSNNFQQLSATWGGVHNPPPPRAVRCHPRNKNNL